MTDSPSGTTVLRRLVRPHRGLMIVLGVASFVGAMLEAGFLVLLTSTVLALAAGRSAVGPLLGLTVPIAAALGVAIGAIALRLVLNLVTVQISATLGARVRTEQRQRLAHSYLDASWALQQSEASGHLQELLSSFVGRVNAAMTALAQGVTAALSLIAFLAAGVVVDAVSTVAVLAALLLLGLALAPIRRRIRAQSQALASIDLEFARTVSELGSLGQEMQTFGVQARFASRVDEVIELATSKMRRVQVLNGLLSPIYTFLAYVAVIGAVAALWIIGVDNLAAVGSVMLLMLRSLSYGQQLIAVSGAINAALPSLERLDKTVMHYRSHRAASGSARPERVTPLVFSDVSFSYSEDRPALTRIDLSVRTGEMLGVIGPSGAGKSTFAQLILGLRAPTDGEVLAGGAGLDDIDRSWWTQRVAFVPQDPLLFTGTVTDNICFFRSHLSEADLRKACMQANVLADIERLPDGFSTHLGERGSQLSGGQRQRLSIARALVGQPEVLVLDEPTSALDGQSEALIRNTLADLHGETTIVIIAHRMSTLDLCDRIMVIQDGMVTGLDTPEQLREQSAFYRNALAVAGIA